MKSYIVFIILIIAFSSLIFLIIQLRECIRARRACDRKLACQLRERDSILYILKHTCFSQEFTEKTVQAEHPKSGNVSNTGKDNITPPPA